jgi:PHD/YefM family antitoxin component YafN of YafNO toxin-antitoxin module
VSYFEDRLFRLFLTPKSVEELSRQIQDLRYTLNSVVQDLAVMKEVLEEKGLMDKALYKRLRVARMIHDHSSHGASAWVDYSIYPYTLDEKDFLRHTFRASEEEVKNFQTNVDGVASRT